MKSRVVVALSGGVDSAVAAALLVRAGHEVVGMMLGLWAPPDCGAVNRCCSPESVERARLVALGLAIPFYVVDAAAAFEEAIVAPFVAESARGRTPNPCVHCNLLVRWRILLERAAAFGADCLATGHYAILDSSGDGSIRLRRGRDREKDQSYALSGLGQEELRRTLLPLGELTKPEVRRLAAEWNLPSAETDESQDLCFLGDQSVAGFVAARAPAAARPGPVMTRDGRILGQHRGIGSVTIGQRHGLGIPAGERMYVLEKDFEENHVIVGALEQTHRSTLTARDARWISGALPGKPFHAEIEVRYRTRPAKGLVTPCAADRFQVDFERPVRAMTPGQIAVIYDGDAVIGSGEID